MTAGLYVRYRCSACKSERVTACTTGRWSNLEQIWEPASEPFDFACLDCESRDIKTLPLTGVELSRARKRRFLRSRSSYLHRFLDIAKRVDDVDPDQMPIPHVTGETHDEDERFMMVRRDLVTQLVAGLDQGALCQNPVNKKRRRDFMDLVTACFQWHHEDQCPGLDQVSFVITGLPEVKQLLAMTQDETLMSQRPQDRVGVTVFRAAVKGLEWQLSQLRG